MPKDIRVARARINNAGGSSGLTGVLNLPSLEQVALVPIRMQIRMDVADADLKHSLGISYYLDGAAWSSAVDGYEDPNFWFVHSFGGNDPNEVIDFPEEGFDLAGPQLVNTYSDAAGARVFGVTLWYYTKMMGALQWAALKTRTSFED